MIEIKVCDGCLNGNMFENAARFHEQVSSLASATGTLVGPAVELIQLIEDDETGAAPQVSGEIMDVTAAGMALAGKVDLNALDNLEHALIGECSEVDRLLCETRCPKVGAVMSLMLEIADNLQ